MEPLTTGVWQVFWRAELPYLLAFAALISALLARRLRAERRTLTHTLLFLAAALAAELAGAVLQATDMARAGTIVRDAAIVATGLAMIRLGGLAVAR